MKALIITLLTVFAFGSALAAPKKAASKSSFSTKKTFRTLIEKNHRVFDQCGKAELKRTKKKVKGVVLVRFVVNGEGKVTESGPVHNTTKSRFIADCLVRGIEQMKFPATFGAPITGSHSFKFNLKK